MTTVINQLQQANPKAIHVRHVSADSEYLGAVDYASFPIPFEVLLNRWYPGIWDTDLTGPNAEEAIAILLGSTFKSAGDLENFRRLMATPGIAADVITTLFPRKDVPLKDRRYYVSEEKVSEVVAARLNQAGETSIAAATAYSHAIKRVLASKGLILASAEQRLARTAEQLTVTSDDLRRILLVEAMRGIFSETRINAATRILDQEATPDLIGEVVGRMFREFATSIPEVVLHLEQFDTVKTMIALNNLDPTSVPVSLRAHPSLNALCGIANFLVMPYEIDVSALSMPAFSTDDIRRACDSVLQIIKTAPSIEAMPLSKYAEFFGEVPAAAPDGIRRGLVVYQMKGQTSKMDVADVIPLAEGAKMALVDPTYVRASGIATPLNNTLLTANAMTGLMNIVADELALTPVEMNADCTFDPTLVTVNIDPRDLVYLALARADSVAFVRQISDFSDVGLTPPSHLLFECNVQEQWRTRVVAANPSRAYFLDPASVILYTSKMMNVEPKTMPDRPQSLKLQYGRDIHYVGDIQEFLNDEIQKPFMLSIPVAPYGGEPIALKLMVNVLGSLMGYAEIPVDRGTAYYASIREPGVDAEVNLMMRIALAYAELPSSDIQGDKARSWLVEVLAPIMMHPSVRVIAERAMNSAILTAKLDGRRLQPQLREVYSRAFFGVALAILSRFGKIDGNVVTGLTKVIPASTLSVKAALTLAQIPSVINGAIHR